MKEPNSKLVITFQSRELLHSEYDWANIQIENNRVGKARCLIDGDCLTIFSINIFPEYAGKGYGTQFVEEAKSHFKKIIADRVRFTAIGFWEKVGFKDNNDGNWVYDSE